MSIIKYITGGITFLALGIAGVVGYVNHKPKVDVTGIPASFFEQPVEVVPPAAAVTPIANPAVPVAAQTPEPVPAPVVETPVPAPVVEAKVQPEVEPLAPYHLNVKTLKKNLQDDVNVFLNSKGAKQFKQNYAYVKMEYAKVVNLIRLYSTLRTNPLPPCPEAGRFDSENKQQNYCGWAGNAFNAR